MRILHAGLVLLLVAAGLLISARFTLRAQERGGLAPADRANRHPDYSPQPTGGTGTAKVSVQDALQRPFSFPFATPTSLSEVCQHLRETLKAPVVLDLAALERRELKPDDPVQLQLEGVRLKTGLKLLLDQLGLTYQVVPEDNLLIVTDTQGTSDPIDRVLSEVKALHRDVHDLQDAVDDILWSLGLDDAGGPKMRKPTIIEELPVEKAPAEKVEPAPPEGAEKRRMRRGA
jgi:hypothetical protein